MVRIAPSIIAGDMGMLAREVKRLDQAGADMIHLDVMDGHFVPNITFGPGVVKALRPVCDLCFDTHLMLEDPVRYVRAFADAGSNRISFHIESQSPTADTLKILRRLGVSPGLALNPETPLKQVIPFLEYADFILVMTVHPGFYGQKLIVEALDKISELRHIIRSRNLDLTIEVDGGVNLANIRQVAAAGAMDFVAGSAVMKADDYAVAISALKFESGA